MSTERKPTAAELVKSVCEPHDVDTIAYWQNPTFTGLSDDPDVYVHNHWRAVHIQDTYNLEAPSGLFGWTITHYALTFTPDGDPELGEDLTDPETICTERAIRAILADLITESNTRTH